MATHPFILSPGSWLGEGTIKFTESPEELKFYCRWTVSPERDGMIDCLQEIEIEGVPERMENNLLFSEIGEEKFRVILCNAVLGEVEGNGVIDDQVIGWEFRDRGDDGFEGFEVYERRGDETYSLRAEWASIDQLRTVVKGQIWRKQAT